MSDSTHKNQKDDSKDPAINVIRSKISALYKDEPDVKEEIIEAAEAGPHRSKHQDYMQQLSTSGFSLAEIQTKWHEYYQGLSDTEKHEVWREFYSAHDQEHKAHTPVLQNLPPSESYDEKEHKSNQPHNKQHSKPKTVSEIKKQITKKAGGGKQLSKKQHLKSLVFGLSMGALVVIILLFSFFNERFIAPFITPSRSVSSTPIIIDPQNTKVGPEPKIIIPKINVEIPVVYDSPSINEADIQASLEDGVVHYPSTPNPGEKGNSVVVGHSSNNIFNSGKYKFAFVLLSRLEKGDTFFVNYKGVRYTYKIYEKKIVSPTDVGVLGPNNKTATMTLITCDPPGTSINRLIVVGEQISPEPSKNSKSTAKQAPAENTDVVPGNSESLWQRIIDIF